MNTIPFLSVADLKEIAAEAGCHIYCDAEYILYGDNRFLAVIANDKGFSGTLDFGEEKAWKKAGTSESGAGKEVSLQLKAYETALFLFKS